MGHRAWIETDAAALRHNAGVLRRALPDDARLGILVKADGYGHGMLTAARAAVDGGADELIVATLDEGLAVRGAHPAMPILVVYPIPPDGVEDAATAVIEISLGGVESARGTMAAWRRVVAARVRAADAQELRIHIEVDTGMGRGGVLPADLDAVLALVETTPGVRLSGIWSHLADGSDAALSREQVDRFEAALAAVPAGGSRRPLRHMAASEGVFAGTSPAYDLARVGLAFYGTPGLDVPMSPAMAALAAELRPAMRVLAQPIRLESVPAGTPIGYGSEWVTERPSRIATLPIGYADGWARSTWPGSAALVRGRRIPLVGRVSMDSVCADVTDVDGVTIDDTFVLLGADGGERIGVEEIARRRGSIPNEVFCDFGGRPERRVLGEADAR